MSHGQQVVFIVGAGRSGTTLLYKLMCLHPRATFYTNLDRMLPRLLAGPLGRLLLPDSPAARYRAWFEGGSAYLDRRRWRRRLVPAPVEGEALFTAAGLDLASENPAFAPGGIEALRGSVARILRSMGGEVFVSKRVANNRRIRSLLQAFPEARFVRLLRDGRDVAHSLSRVSWWNDHVLFWAGVTPPELCARGEDMLGICARNWLIENELLDRDLEAVPAGNRLELTYERLLAAPRESYERVMAHAGLEVSEALAAVLDSAALHPVAPKWVDAWSRDETEAVMQVIAPQLAAYGYLR